MVFQNKFQKDIVMVMVNLFSSLKIDYFFGGSRRFGYYSVRSDVDIFLSISCEEDQEKIYDAIGKIGLTIHELIDDDPEYENQVCRLMDFIHLVFIKDEHEFLVNKMNHFSVKKMMDKNPILLDVARSMREYGTSGSGVYKILFDLCN